MSALGERTLMLSLKYTEAIEEVVRHGLNPKVVPSEALREVVTWALSYFQTSAVAPTPEVLKERFGPDLFADNMIDLDDDVEETIEWAIGDLEGTYVQQQVGLFTRKLATEIGSAPPEDRVEALGRLSSELAGYVLELQPRTTHADIREVGSDLLADYDMAANTEGVRGMMLGIPVVDEHLQGIWPGELVTCAGPPGSGKSFFANFVAHHEWNRGRPTTLFTLENSIKMTQMRIACCALEIDIKDLQTGKLESEEYAALAEWCNDVLIKSDTPLNIINPEIVNRSPQAIVATARAYDTESLIVDQLTHVEAVDPLARDQRNQEIGKIVRTLGNLISTGRNPLPCLMMHQVNREGVKHARSTGRILMEHMAEGAEIERTSSVVLSLYASEEDKKVTRMQLQMLKQRRVIEANWTLTPWLPWMGQVRGINTVTADDFEGIDPA